MRVTATLKPLVQHVALFPDLCGPVFHTEAAKRVYVGELAERIACAALGLRHLAIDGWAEICPDLAIVRGRMVQCYTEVKSCGNSRAVIVYASRHAKECAFRGETGTPYLYAVVRHSVRCQEVRDWMGLVRAFASAPVEIKVMALEELSVIIARMGPPRILNPAYVLNHKPHGPTRSGYIGGGWRVRYSDIRTGVSALRFVEIDGVSIGVTVSRTIAVDKLQASDPDTFCLNDF